MSKPHIILLLVIGGATIGFTCFFAYKLLSSKGKNIFNEKYNEKEINYYSLEEAIGWFKSNKTSLSHTACIFKESFESGSGSSIYRLKHCFLDASKRPLLDINSPVLIIKTNKIDEDLISAFKNKDMILLE